MNRATEIMPEQKERQPTREGERCGEETEQVAMHATQATRDRRPLQKGRRPGPILMIVGALALAGSWACSKPEGDASMKPETIDIDAPADAGLSFEQDVQAQRRDEGLAGVLPGGFPADLPLLEPASVVDTLESEDGRMIVVLQHPASAGEVETFLRRALPAAGWRSEGGSAYRNAQGHAVEITVEAMGGVARVRVVF